MCILPIYTIFFLLCVVVGKHHTPPLSISPGVLGESSHLPPHTGKELSDPCPVRPGLSSPCFGLSPLPLFSSPMWTVLNFLHQPSFSSAWLQLRQPQAELGGKRQIVWTPPPPHFRASCLLPAGKMGAVMGNSKGFAVRLTWI